MFVCARRNSESVLSGMPDREGVQLIQNEEQNAVLAVRDVGTLLPDTAIERMARFFLTKMRDTDEEMDSRTFVNSERKGYD